MSACGAGDNAAGDKTDTSAQPANAPIRLLEADEFLDGYEAAPAAYLIDCRTAGEFAAGSLPGALNIDYTAAGFAAEVNELDTSRSVFVFCQRGGRSARAAQVFAKAGFAEVNDLEGGYGGLKH